MDEILFGEVALPIQPRMVAVVGQVAAGLWLEGDDLSMASHKPVPYVPTRYKNAEQRAYKVSGTSMNLAGIVDGSYVITIPYWQVRERIQDGDLVVVERREGSLLERTVKLVTIGPTSYTLESRSSDPKWEKSIITIPRGGDVADDRVVEIVGLVVGSYTPF